MLSQLSASFISVVRSAARKLSGWRRRQYQAEVAIEYCGGSARKAESKFGWGRKTVTVGLQEKHSGVRQPENFQARGRRRTEELHPELKAAIIRLAEPQSQADPKFQTTLAFTRLTGQALRTGLLGQFTGDQCVPSERTARRMLTRLGFPQRKVRKTLPKKRSHKPTPSSNTCGASILQ
jgi:transposase